VNGTRRLWMGKTAFITREGDGAICADGHPVRVLKDLAAGGLLVERDGHPTVHFRGFTNAMQWASCAVHDEVELIGRCEAAIADDPVTGADGNGDGSRRAY
jgi:hypothetical protein